MFGQETKCTYVLGTGIKPRTHCCKPALTCFPKAFSNVTFLYTLSSQLSIVTSSSTVEVMENFESSHHDACTHMLRFGFVPKSFNQKTDKKGRKSYVQPTAPASKPVRNSILFFVIIVFVMVICYLVGYVSLSEVYMLLLSNFVLGVTF